MRRYLHYHYNSQGTIIFHYSDDERHFRSRYIGYTLREAIQRFRQEYNLQRKHLIIRRLYEAEV